MNARTTPRIGPMMIAAARFVAANPGCPKLPVAEAVGPHGSRKYGYETVNRALAAGLIKDQGTHPVRYSLVITDAGRAVI